MPHVGSIKRTRTSSQQPGASQDQPVHAIEEHPHPKNTLNDMCGRPRKHAWEICYISY